METTSWIGIVSLGISGITMVLYLLRDVRTYKRDELTDLRTENTRLRERVRALEDDNALLMRRLTIGNRDRRQ